MILNSSGINFNSNLSEKYQTKPIHSIEEIIKLKTIFPDNIKQFNVYYNNVIVAGQLFLNCQSRTLSIYF
jgi:hypothetical protein